MLAEFGGFLEKIIVSTWNMLNSSSPWIIFSFLVAGLLHEFLKPEKIQKTAIGSGKISGVFWTTISGMFIEKADNMWISSGRGVDDGIFCSIFELCRKSFHPMFGTYDRYDD